MNELYLILRYNVYILIGVNLKFNRFSVKLFE